MDELAGPLADVRSTRARWARRIKITAAIAVALTVAGAGIWSWSWPGVSSAGVVVTILGSVLLLVLLTRLSLRVAAVGATLLILGAVLAASTGPTPAPLRIRWAVSEVAFQAEVDRVPAPIPTSDAEGNFSDYPAACPAQLGSIPLEGCASLDGGYLYLQRREAVTDSSGIAYLPTGPEGHPGLASEEWRPLGGPWYAWTCHC